MPERFIARKLLHGLQRFQRQIQFQHIHTRLAEKSELPACKVFFNQAPHGGFFHIARSSNTRRLIQCRRRTEVRVESACRSRHQINRKGLRIARISLPQCLHARLHDVQ